MQDAQIVDFTSDTGTLPTTEMLDAMREAPLGDDVYGWDPTVNRLEALAAQMMGKEAGLFVASGTMGNLIALMAHTHAGQEVILEALAPLLQRGRGDGQACRTKSSLSSWPARNNRTERCYRGASEARYSLPGNCSPMPGEYA